MEACLGKGRGVGWIGNYAGKVPDHLGEEGRAGRMAGQRQEGSEVRAWEDQGASAASCLVNKDSIAFRLKRTISFEYPACNVGV